MTDKNRNPGKAAAAAAERILGREAAAKFHFTGEEGMGEGTFRLTWKNGEVYVAGMDGVSLVSGLNWYLRNFCGIQISWETGKPVLPEKLPEIKGAVCKKTPYRYRYYLNYCTYSYSMAFWDWERWEKELDYMALRGINMALSLTGQEMVWRETYREAGMCQEDVDECLTDPVHYAWFFMGNMTSFGERMPDAWYSDRVKLAGKIHTRMKELGITPVLPGFYGAVPENLKERYPEAELVGQGEWCGFSRPTILSDKSPLFAVLAEIFYRKQRELIGDITPCFSADPFHEGGRKEKFRLADFGRAVYDQMKKYRPDAVWVVQAWDANPYLELFDGVDKNNVLILNLLAGRIQGGEEITGQYGGLSWIYCPVHSYGGRNGMYGFLRTVAREPIRCLHAENSSMCGIGLAPEAIESNPVFHDLFWDLVYREEEICLPEWLENYVLRRYGRKNDKLTEAWRLLEDSVYNSFVPQPGGAESFLCARPGFNVTSVSAWGPRQVNYDMEFVKRAGRLLYGCYRKGGVPESGKSCKDGLLYDVIDVTRQCLSNVSRIRYARLMYLLDQGKMDIFEKEAERFLHLIRLQDKILWGHESFRFSKWLESAASCGRRYGMEKEFIRMAKTLVTVWGDERCPMLHDYSAREWSGLTGSFYYERWSLFFDSIKKCRTEGEKVPTLSLSRDWEDGTASARAKEEEPVCPCIMGNGIFPGKDEEKGWYQWEEEWTRREECSKSYGWEEFEAALAEAYDCFI